MTNTNTNTSTGDDQPVSGDGVGAATDLFARTLQRAYRETHLHSPQGVSDVEERLRSKLGAAGLTLTTDVLRALAFAIVNDRDT